MTDDHATGCLVEMLGLAPAEWHRGGYTVSTAPARLDRDRVVAWLGATYWGADYQPAVLRRSIDAAVPFGLYAPPGDQVGFARVVTDFCRFGWLSDVFVAPPHRRRGLGRWLVECALAYQPLAGIERWLLATRDQQALYRGVGFSVADVDGFMVRVRFPPR